MHHLLREAPRVGRHSRPVFADSHSQPGQRVPVFYQAGLLESLAMLGHCCRSQEVHISHRLQSALAASGLGILLRVLMEETSGVSTCRPG